MHAKSDWGACREDTRKAEFIRDRLQFTKGPKETYLRAYGNAISICKNDDFIVMNGIDDKTRFASLRGTSARKQNGYWKSRVLRTIEEAMDGAVGQVAQAIRASRGFDGTNSQLASRIRDEIWSAWDMPEPTMEQLAHHEQFVPPGDEEALVPDDKDGSAMWRMDKGECMTWAYTSLVAMRNTGKLTDVMLQLSLKRNGSIARSYGKIMGEKYAMWENGKTPTPPTRMPRSKQNVGMLAMVKKME